MDEERSGGRDLGDRRTRSFNPARHPELFVDSSGRLVPLPVRIRLLPVKEYLAMTPVTSGPDDFRVASDTVPI